MSFHSAIMIGSLERKSSRSEVITIWPSAQATRWRTWSGEVTALWYQRCTRWSWLDRLAGRQRGGVGLQPRPHQGHVAQVELGLEPGARRLVRTAAMSVTFAPKVAMLRKRAASASFGDL